MKKTIRMQSSMSPNNVMTKQEEKKNSVKKVARGACHSVKLLTTSRRFARSPSWS